MDNILPFPAARDRQHPPSQAIFQQEWRIYRTWSTRTIVPPGSLRLPASGPRRGRARSVPLPGYRLRRCDGLRGRAHGTPSPIITGSTSPPPRWTCTPDPGGPGVSRHPRSSGLRRSAECGRTGGCGVDWLAAAPPADPGEVRGPAGPSARSSARMDSSSSRGHQPGWGRSRQLAAALGRPGTILDCLLTPGMGDDHRPRPRGRFSRNGLAVGILGHEAGFAEVQEVYVAPSDLFRLYAMRAGTDA